MKHFDFCCVEQAYCYQGETLLAQDKCGEAVRGLQEGVKCKYNVGGSKIGVKRKYNVADSRKGSNVITL